LGYAGLLGSGVAVGLFGLLPGFPAVLLYAFLFGVTITVFGLVWTNLLQEYVPIEKLGRVSSIDSLGSYILLPLGYAASGWLTDKVGPAQVFLAGGMLSILLVAIGLLMKDIRRLE
jgi:MFS family permease